MLHKSRLSTIERGIWWWRWRCCDMWAYWLSPVAFLEDHFLLSSSYSTIKIL